MGHHVERFAMRRRGTFHTMLVGTWLLFCGIVVGGLMWVLMGDVLLALLLAVAAIPFIWMLSVGWRDADCFKEALRIQVEGLGKSDT